MGLPDDKWEAFTIIIQFGAILSVVAVYWRKFWNVLVGLPTSPQARQFTINVLVAFLPAAVRRDGVQIHQWTICCSRASRCRSSRHVDCRRHHDPHPGAHCAQPRHLDGDHLPFWKAVQIGFCQCLAIIPGVSRSGATILGAEMLGVERKAAAAFTFYLAVPTMFGATVFEMYKKWIADRQRRPPRISPSASLCRLLSLILW